MPLSDAEKIAYGHSLEGTEIARMITIACFSLAIYEYMITLDEEVKYFWSGKWTATRILFLMNRYLPLCIMIISIVCYSVPVSIATPKFCTLAIQSAFLLNLVAITIIQGILVIRIWYLFQQSKIVKIAITIAFLLSVVLSMVFLYLTANNVRVIPAETLTSIFGDIVIEGCKAARPMNFWRIYLPSLVLHTFLYILTAVRALRNRRLLKEAPVLKRLLRDGGFFYFVVFVSVTLTTVGSILKDAPAINIPAIYSHFLLTTTSIAVSRVMLSIHSLAHKLGSDSAWLLNNVELSRVGWRKGAREGELIVDHFSPYGNDDLESVKSPLSRTFSPLKESRVGVYDKYSWLCEYIASLVHMEHANVIAGELGFVYLSYCYL